MGNQVSYEDSFSLNNSKVSVCDEIIPLALKEDIMNQNETDCVKFTDDIPCGEILVEKQGSDSDEQIRIQTISDMHESKDLASTCGHTSQDKEVACEKDMACPSESAKSAVKRLKGNESPPDSREASKSKKKVKPSLGAVKAKMKLKLSKKSDQKTLSESFKKSTKCELNDQDVIVVDDCGGKKTVFDLQPSENGVKKMKGREKPLKIHPFFEKKCKRTDSKSSAGSMDSLEKPLEQLGRLFTVKYVVLTICPAY